MRHHSRFPVRGPGVVVLLLLALGLSAHGKEICEAKIDCIFNSFSDTLRLPESAVMISKEMGHCSPAFFAETLQAGHADTVSVFIIIDHSGSMSYMDSNATRYQMARDLIDSIYALSPASEVGIAVFSNQLLYNYQQDAFFVQLDPASGWLDSYAPLTKLNSTVGGTPAVTRLKQALALSATEKDAGNNWKLTQGYYGDVGRTPFTNAVPAGYNGTTDVSLAFEAAKKAMLSATRPPERQYIVFLSDGEPQNVDIERQSHINDFVTATGVPTTFTAFWINQGQPIPSQIVNMTNNIKVNGYSTTNQNSKIWWNASTANEFFREMLGYIAGHGPYVVLSHPVSITFGGVTTTSFDSTWAYFTDGFPLTSDVTTFPVSYTWHWEDPWDRDSTRTFNAIVKRVKGSTSWPTGVTQQCWEQGYLQILHESVPVSTIQANWTTLEVRFYPSAAYPVQSATLVITNASASDSLTLIASNSGNYFAATFLRDYGAPSIDNVLQNGMSDSVVAIYRNPDLPFDVVRTAVKVLPPRDLEIRSAYYLDQAGGMANGYPDVIRVVLGDTLFPDEVNLIQNYLRINSTRGVTVSSIQPNGAGFDIILTEPASGLPNTGLLPNESIHIDSIPNLNHGGWFPTADAAIVDSMGPVIVRASYLDIAETDARDTLIVTFSEPMKTVGSSEPFNLNRGTDISDYALRVSAVSQTSTSAVFAVIPVTGYLTPQPGDSIWIDVNGMVTDSVNVRQAMVLNVKRPLSFSSLLRIVSASYGDDNADGLPDVIHVTMSQPADSLLLDSLVKAIKLPAYRQFGTVPRASYSVTANGFDIRVSQGSGTTPVTSVDARDSLVVTRRTTSSSGEVVDPSAVPITDGMAPVIVRATFLPASYEVGGTKPPDTLEVTFSERMPRISSSQPFVLTSSDSGTQYLLTVAPLSGDDSTTQTFLVTAIAGNDYPQDGDVIRIAFDKNVTDRNGVVQDDPENRGVSLDVKAYRVRYNVVAAPNPCDPSATPLPASITSIDGRVANGIAIVATPQAMAGGTVALSGKASLYDAVGNAIFLNQRGVYDSGRKRVFFVWDGTNRQGRKVGSGAYWAVVSISDGNTTETKTVKIGVKR